MVEHYTIKEFSLEDRPREKLCKYGPSSLNDKELLAIILRTGTKNKNVISVADDILKNIGGVTSLKDVTYNQLLKYKGIGSVKAIDILATVELAKRVFTETIDDKVICDSPDVIAKYLRYKLSGLKQEVFLVLDLDTKGKIIAEREVFRGSLSMSIVHPREVFKDSLKNSAASIVCIHNHPSGDATPSVEDIHTTIKLQEVGKIMGIDVLDHIVIASQGYCSIRRVLNYLASEDIDIEALSNARMKFLENKFKFISKY